MAKSALSCGPCSAILEPKRSTRCCLAPANPKKGSWQPSLASAPWWLPRSDTYVAWRDVWPGAAVTAALFEIGKLLIGLYIGKQALESTYGAAASLVVLLIWVYYSSQLVLMGAEFTRAYAQRRAVGNMSASDDRPTDAGVDHYVHAAVERSPYAAALAALLVGWLLARLELRHPRAGGTTVA